MDEVLKNINHKAVSDFCRKNFIKKLAIFGSVSRGEEKEDSDIDVLVEFEKNHIPGLKFFGLNEELEPIFHRRVDLNTAGFLSEQIRRKVLNEMIVIYEQ